MSSTSPRYQWCDIVKWPRPLHGHRQGPLPSGHTRTSFSIYPPESELPPSILRPLRADGQVKEPEEGLLPLTSDTHWAQRFKRCHRRSEISMRVTGVNPRGQIPFKHLYTKFPHFTDQRWWRFSGCTSACKCFVFLIYVIIFLSFLNSMFDYSVPTLEQHKH